MILFVNENCLAAIRKATYSIIYHTCAALIIKLSTRLETFVQYHTYHSFTDFFLTGFPIKGPEDLSHPLLDCVMGLRSSYAS